jgi:hypothetical protein
MSEKRRHEEEEFGELLKFTLAGFGASLILGWVLDLLGVRKNPFGEWAVRTLAGEGESILEGVFAIRKRLSGSAHSLAQAYGWGKLAGMVFPWVVDFGSRAAGVDLYGAEGFYVPYFYAMSDQIGANVAGFIYIYRHQRSVSGALSGYFRNPVMLTSLAVILLVPCGLLTARLLGFSPDRNLLVALETIAANLCWLPPLVGYLRERKR